MAWSANILQDKRILITGASSGIGRSCAIVCSQLGAQIIAVGRNEKRLHDTLETLTGSGHLSIACELTDSVQVREKLDCLKSTKPISGFIHSAGIERTVPLKNIDPDSFGEMLRINLISAVQIAGIISSPKYSASEGSAFVFISSVSGISGDKGKVEYSSSKAALFGIVKSMAKELAQKKIRVNSISPAMVETPMLREIFSTLPEESVQMIRDRHLLGIPAPEEIANLCAFLISDLGKSITGENIIIDSGYSLV